MDEQVSDKIKPILEELEADKALLADMGSLEEAILGAKVEDKPVTALKWSSIKSDNLFVRTLKKTAVLYAHAVKKEIQTAEKNVIQARKVFHGR